MTLNHSETLDQKWEVLKRQAQIINKIGKVEDKLTFIYSELDVFINILTTVVSNEIDEDLSWFTELLNKKFKNEFNKIERNTAIAHICLLLEEHGVPKEETYKSASLFLKQSGIDVGETTCRNIFYDFRKLLESVPSVREFFLDPFIVCRLRKYFYGEGVDLDGVHNHIRAPKALKEIRNIINQFFEDENNQKMIDDAITVAFSKRREGQSEK